MKGESLVRKAKGLGFNNIDDFVKANLHYLPKEKQKLFYTLVGNAPDGLYASKLGERYG